MSFKEQLKEYFSFTKGESQGIIVLLILLIIAVLVNLSSEYFVSEKKYDFSKYEKLFTELHSDSSNSDIISISEKYDTLKLFKFNPNKLLSGEAKQLGFSEYQFKMIQKYLKTGASFKYKSDLAKIYSIKNKQFTYLKPFVDLPEKGYEKISDNYVYGNSKGNKKNTYFLFDPNTLNDSGWSELGFSEKQILSIRKYINAGGKFFQNEDLKKLYVINDKKFADLEPYINIPRNEESSILKNNHKKVDVNNLSTEEMKQYGKFWQYNATRIVKYRNLLGGFYSKEQLLEVYGMKREYYLKIADDIIIDKSKPEKINVNFAEVSELGRHPYISWQNAEKIIEFRNKNGAYRSIEEIKIKNSIPDEVFKKIAPYIKVK